MIEKEISNNWIRKILSIKESFLTIAVVFCELIWVISQHCNQVNFFRSRLQNVWYNAVQMMYKCSHKIFRTLIYYSKSIRRYKKEYVETIFT